MGKMFLYMMHHSCRRYNYEVYNKISQSFALKVKLQNKKNALCPERLNSNIKKECVSISSVQKTDIEAFMSF